MDKIKIRDIRMGDIFSRAKDGFLYTRTGKSLPTSGEDLPLCYCLDSESEYGWLNDEVVCLQYREEETMQEVKKVYKALQETPEGKLISLMAQSDLCCYPLDYEEGRVTYAPEGSMGIFTDDTLGKAQHTGRANKSHCTDNGGTLVLYEAVPLGKMMNKATDLTFASRDRYPAILLGKEVWREKPREPEVTHTFKVGDRVRVKEGITRPRHSFANGWKSREDIGVVQSIREDTLYVKFPEVEGYGGWDYSCHAPEMELAPPEPEWVDVTEECTVELYPSANAGLVFIKLKHKNETIAYFGDTHSLAQAIEETEYKLEFTSGESYVQSFKVLKKDC